MLGLKYIYYMYEGWVLTQTKFINRKKKYLYDCPTYFIYTDMNNFDILSKNSEAFSKETFKYDIEAGHLKIIIFHPLYCVCIKGCRDDKGLCV